MHFLKQTQQIVMHLFISNQFIVFILLGLKCKLRLSLASKKRLAFDERLITATEKNEDTIRKSSAY